MRFIFLFLEIFFSFVFAFSQTEQTFNQIPFVSAFWKDAWREKPLNEIIAGANAGDVNAQIRLAWYYHGKDQKKAMFWYNKAAKQDNWIALNNLAVFYFHGIGVNADRQKALILFERATKSGDKDAYANMGYSYLYLQHPRYEEAAKWFLKAAELGDSYAQFEIGQLYLSGLGVVKDPADALKWFYISSSHGYLEAQQKVMEIESMLAAEQVEIARNLAKSFSETGAIDTNPSFSRENRTIAVLDMVGKGFPQEKASLITDKLRSEIVKSCRYTVLERLQIEDVLKEQGFQKSGCTNEECAVKLGQLLGAKTIITGSIGLLGETYLISLKIIDVSTSRIIKTIDEQVKCSIEDLVRITVPMVAKQITF